MLPDIDFDDVRDFVLALLLWALGGWGLWVLRGWAMELEGEAGTILLGTINLIALLYIFVLLPLKNLISAFLSDGADRR
ncbi:MAG: hypothetical protein O3A88_06680 [Proteobacteria bacterium]|nr:hypothetical protein [Pseudomonadota bacterium]